MVHFILDVIQSVDFSGFSVNQRGTGSRQYRPSILLALLVYCYSTGRFSSRVIEETTYCDVAVRYICAGSRSCFRCILVLDSVVPLLLLLIYTGSLAALLARAFIRLRRVRLG